MAKRFLNIAITMIAGIFSVILIFWRSGAPNTYNNGFNRNIKNKFLTPFHSMDLKLNNWNIVGLTKDHLYLWNRSGPDSICTINYDLTKLHTESWRVDNRYNPNFLAIRIDSPSMEIHDRRHNIIYRSKLKYQQRINEFVDTVPKIPFDLVQRISGETYIARTINHQLNRYTLTKFTYPGIPTIEDTSSIIKQVDGFICTDGILCYDSSLKYIVYIYYYRNQYLTLDSNLLLQRKSKTIDTITTAPVKIHLFKDIHLKTFESPTVPSNKRAISLNGLLYIQSDLLADNEDRRVFSNSSVIDVYDLKQGRYLYSFHIPHFGKFGISDFIISDKLLIAIQGNFISSYQINPN